MKTIMVSRPARWYCRSVWIAACCVLLAFMPHGVTGQEDSLRIVAIELDQSQAVVSVSVPPGLVKITLEGRERFGEGAWVPKAVARLDGAGGQVVFHMEVSKQVEMVRVRAEAEELLPLSFYSGTNEFGGEPTSEATPGPAAMRLFMDDAMAGAPESGDETREVVESDLWNVQGDRLYFFNQLRGLQVIDIAKPDRPVVAGQLDLPAAGEQMYLLRSGQVVLLARGGCGYGGETESRVLVVEVAGDQPEVLASLPVPGQIQESRLVGTALYVASQSYRPVPGSATDPTTTVWEWGLTVTSFDLADPAHPEPGDTLWYAGYGNVVAATDRYFFVVTQEPTNWRQSVVHSIDIRDPHGAMYPANTLRPAGRVPDKFKLQLYGDVFTVISQVQTTELFTRLETFSFAEPEAPRYLGGLSLGLSERLHATRFAGDRVYVVTFFVPYQLDPLFVVDLSDPARPTILGELEIPGFSTFLYPRGDQLVALGIETNQTTVSLFDVADPAQPGLLSRVTVGEGWAWTEANWNEKAFKVVEEQGLILLPFQSWTTEGYVQRVQLIDLNDQNLVVRGVIDHQFAPRRATWHRDRILSISARELLTVDATDRDHPVVVGQTALAWPVDQLALWGEFVVEAETGAYDWWGGGAPVGMLRVARRATPNDVLETLTLPEGPILGLSVRGDRLYVAQGSSQSTPWPVPLREGETDPEVEPSPPNFFLTVIDGSALPQLTVAGKTSLTTESYTGGDWEPVWLGDDLLVWAGGGGYYWWWAYDYAVPMAEPAGLAAPDRLWWPWWNGNGGQLLAFFVPPDAPPAPASALNLGSNVWWNFSKAFAQDQLVYLSHQATVFEEGLIVAGLTVTNEAGVVGTWVQRHFLDVVDYTDAVHPTVRPPVNIPGQLRAIARQGALLFTVGYHYDPKSGVTDWREILDGSAYDGVQAALVDSLPLPVSWPHPTVFGLEGTFFLGTPAQDATVTDEAAPSVATWVLAESGRFERVGEFKLKEAASQLGYWPGLLAYRDQGNQLILLDASEPAALREVGRGQTIGCLWFDLDRAQGVAGAGLWMPLGSYGVQVLQAESLTTAAP